MPRLLIFSIFTGLLLPAAGFAQVKLSWQLNENDSFFVEEVAAIRQKLNLREEMFEHGYKHTKTSQFLVKSKDKDGGVVLEQQILKVRAESMGRDSKADGALRKLEGGKLTFTLDAHAQIVKMEGYEELLKRVGGSKAIAEQALTAQSLRTPVELLFAFIPDKEVAEGDTWQSTNVYGFGPLGQFTSKNTCKLKSADAATRSLIEIRSAWQFTAAAQEQLKQMKLAGVKMHRHTAGGELIFDAEAGRLVRCNFNYSATGIIEIALPNVVNMAFEQQGDVELRVADKMAP